MLVNLSLLLLGSVIDVMGTFCGNQVTRIRDDCSFLKLYPVHWKQGRFIQHHAELPPPSVLLPHAPTAAPARNKSCCASSLIPSAVTSS